MTSQATPTNTPQTPSQLNWVFAYGLQVSTAQNYFFDNAPANQAFVTVVAVDPGLHVQYNKSKLSHDLDNLNKALREAVTQPRQLKQGSHNVAYK